MPGLNIALVGFGKMGQIHYRNLKTLQKEGLVNQIYGNDVIMSKVPDDCMGIEQLYTLQTQDNKVDGVIIAVPTKNHLFAIDLFVFDYLIPVFCEKPLCTDEEIANDYLRNAFFSPLEKLEKENNKALLFVGYIERYNPAVVEFIKQIKLLDEDDKIIFIDIVRSNALLKNSISGNTVSDLGVHDFDILNQLFDAVNVDRSYIINDNYSTVFANTTLTVSNDKNTTPVNITISWIDGIKRREYTCYTEKKVIHVNLITQNIEITDRITGRKIVYMLNEEPAYLEMKAFLNFIRQGSLFGKYVDPLGVKAQEIALEVINKAKVYTID